MPLLDQASSNSAFIRDDFVTLPGVAASAPAPAAGAVNALLQAPTARQTPQDEWIRIADVILASAALVFLAPAFALIALAVRLDSKGPILFRQRRAGLGARPFMIFKFRTMTVTESDDMTRQASRNDPRVTRVGAFLRRASLDELPQLLNVVRGDMSLVGPRPHPLSLDYDLARRFKSHRKRFAVRPGITGLAQVRGYRGELLTEESARGRVAHDVLWTQRRCVWLYISIIVQTALVLFSQDEAY